MHTVEFSVNHGNAELVQCTLTWELITFKQLLKKSTYGIIQRIPNSTHSLIM